LVVDERMQIADVEQSEEVNHHRLEPFATIAHDRDHALKETTATGEMSCKSR